MKKILFIVDPQNDFIDGTLPVPHAKEIMTDASRYINACKNDYEFIIVSCDEHPIKHCSFVNQGGQWPMHCIKHSVGAAIFPPIADALVNFELYSEPSLYADDGFHKFVTYLEKGRYDVDEYSAVDSKENSDYVERLINSNEIDQIDIFGIAGDICVLNTIKGLIEMGFEDKICVLQDFCPSIDDGTALKNLIKEKNLMTK